METVANEYDLERALYEALMVTLRASLPAKALDTSVPPDLLAPWLEEYIRAPETLRRGRIVTDLHRLGVEIWPAAATIFKGYTDIRSETLRSDARGPMGLHVFVQNVSKAPSTIQIAAREVVKKRSDRGVPTRWDDRPVMATVAPGEIVDLTIHYAVVALRSGTWRIHHPDLWENSGAIPSTDTLVEVGYALDLYGVDSRRGAEKVKKAG